MKTIIGILSVLLSLLILGCGGGKDTSIGPGKGFSYQRIKKKEFNYER